jgi:hypothetical protein
LPQTLGVFVGPTVLLEQAKEFLDLEESTGMFLLIFAVKQVGVQVGEQRLLGTVVCAQTVSQGVAGG